MRLLVTYFCMYMAKHVRNVISTHHQKGKALLMDINLIELIWPLFTLKLE